MSTRECTGLRQSLKPTQVDPDAMKQRSRIKSNQPDRTRRSSANKLHAAL